MVESVKKKKKEDCLASAFLAFPSSISAFPIID